MREGPLPGFDDVGDPGGAPVVYLHGTPDSRLARHPDDGLAAAAGVRLLAVDRPGYGGSPAGPFLPAALDLLDHLGLDRVAVVAWSGGARAGLELATSGRVSALHLVAGVVPVEAYADPAVAAVAEHRTALVGMAEGLDAGSVAELAAEIAPMLAPHPCDHDLALAHQAESRVPADQARLAAIPGALDRLADSLVAAVGGGLAGVEADVVGQVRPWDVDLDAVRAPVRLWWGDDDAVTPLPFGRWYAGRLPDAELHVVPGAGHYLPFTHWDRLLAALTPEAG
jgi:pimeloyl-ACP methyl ester carboxylesterase